MVATYQQSFNHAGHHVGVNLLFQYQQKCSSCLCIPFNELFFSWLIQFAAGCHNSGRAVSGCRTFILANFAIQCLHVICSYVFADHAGVVPVPLVGQLQQLAEAAQEEAGSTSSSSGSRC